MEMIQFAMVEDLAHIVKDNLFCKHLVLSTEEALVDCLQNDRSPDGILELQPMSSYHRSLLHRLAEIFGFFHESVGEGEARHLVLERCAESSIPPILVGDLLRDIDNHQSSIATDILRRKGPLDVNVRVGAFSPSMTVKEREATYLAARERIFSACEEGEKENLQQKPRCIPVVARRMIAHALGQRMSSLSLTPPKSSEFEQLENLGRSLEKRHVSRMHHPRKGDRFSSSKKLHETKVCKYVVRNLPCTPGAESKQNTIGSSGCPPNRKPTPNTSSMKSAATTSINLEKEQAGAAKRIFANALGLPRGKGIRCE